jgi:hypothetical protein
MSTTNTKTPRKQPDRFVNLTPAENGNPYWILSITIVTPRVTKESKVETFSYWLKLIPADFGIAFELEKFEKVEGEDSSYHANLDLANPHNSTCTCKGFARFGLNCGRPDNPGCKHVAALFTLARSGKLPIAGTANPAHSPRPNSMPPNEQRQRESGAQLSQADRKDHAWPPR